MLVIGIVKGPPYFRENALYPNQGNFLHACTDAILFHLNEAAETKVILDNDIYIVLVGTRRAILGDRKHTINRCHDEADLRCVGRAREMSVDLLGLVLV
jgi:hypothetical protein